MKTDNKDKLWVVIWIVGLLIVWIWNKIFLHEPALIQLQYAFLNTIFISFLVIILATLLAWFVTHIMHYLKGLKTQIFRVLITFFLNIIRSIPQIVGVLIGYIFLTLLIQQEIVSNTVYIIFNKQIAIFGIAIFLQCSIDFIISVGLSTEISPVNLPVTLGSLLAKIDSKQDILALGYAISHWSYVSNIFFEHLQGITVAFLIVFSLLCIYHISKGYAKRHRL